MADSQDFGIKTSPRLLGISAAGLTLVFAAREADISQVHLDFSILALSLAAIAAIVALLLEIYLTDEERRRWLKFKRKYPDSAHWKHFNFEEPWPDKPRSGIIALLMVAMAMALLSLFGPLGWWRLLPLAIVGMIASFLYASGSMTQDGILHDLFAAACVLSLLGFVLGALYPIVAWSEQSGKNIAARSSEATPTQTATDSSSNPQPAKVEIDLLLRQFAQAVRSGNTQRIDAMRRKIAMTVEIRLTEQCPAMLKGEKGDRGEKGEKGEKGDRGTHGEAGPPGVCGS
jgi:ABC-type multidrug transport system fused ATPase/permease subunit